MVKLTNEIKDTLAAAKLAWLATATKDGTPNVVVVTAVRLLDGSLKGSIRPRSFPSR